MSAFLLETLLWVALLGSVAVTFVRFVTSPAWQYWQEHREAERRALEACRNAERKAVQQYLDQELSK